MDFRIKLHGSVTSTKFKMVTCGKQIKSLSLEPWGWVIACR